MPKPKPIADDLRERKGTSGQNKYRQADGATIAAAMALLARQQYIFDHIFSPALQLLLVLVVSLMMVMMVLVE